MANQDNVATEAFTFNEFASSPTSVFKTPLEAFLAVDRGYLNYAPTKPFHVVIQDTRTWMEIEVDNG